MKQVLLFFYYAAFAVVGALAGSYIFESCQKSHAAPRPASVVLSSGCADSADVYTPVAVSSFNAGVIAFNPAHFTRICNEVYVSGTLFASNAFDTLHSSFIQVSLPVASDLSGPNVSGQALIGFNGTAQPAMGSIGFVHLVGQTGAVINWLPVKKNSYGLIYSFSYTIK